MAPPRFAVSLSQSSCAPGSTLHEVGAEVTEVYSAAGSGVCQPLTRMPPDTRSFRAGAAIPASSFVELKNLFADAACTSPLGVEDVPTCASSPSSRHVLARTFTATTPYYRAYNTGPKHEGPTVERPFGKGTPSDCRPAERAPGAAYYQQGAEVAATTLVEGTWTRD
ncbi:hypothetical protein NVS55_15500 [Myxococcus stipitatus]|uniref:hypothetical protein n=1 Tax=Myxococcus stipitatus TaxID=83455 RepID=UPI0031450DD6